MDKYHEVKKTEAAPGAPQRDNLADGLRRLAYASVGLFGVMSDEVGAFYEKCVARGEQRAKESRASAHGRQAARRTRTKPVTAKQPITAVLARSRLATKSEMDALSARVDALAREIDVLAAQWRSR